MTQIHTRGVLPPIDELHGCAPTVDGSWEAPALSLVTVVNGCIRNKAWLIGGSLEAHWRLIEGLLEAH